MAEHNPWILPLIGGQNAHVIPGALLDYSGGNNLFKIPTTAFLHTGNGIVHGSTILPETLVDDAAKDYELHLVCAIPVNGAAGEEVSWRFRYESWPEDQANQEDDPSSYAASREFDHNADVSSWQARKFNRVVIDLEASPYWIKTNHFFKFALERRKDSGSDDFDDTIYVHKAFLRIPF